MKCTNCGQDFIFNPSKDKYSYGLYMGKPFIVNVCFNCAETLSNEEYKKLEEKIANEYRNSEV